MGGQIIIDEWGSNVKTKIVSAVLLPVVLAACGAGSSHDGNPLTGKANVNLTTSRMGASGGFVDADGDGNADLVVGAPEARLTTAKEGAALVFLKNGAGYAQDAAIVLKGEANGDQFGFSVANVGDINGDGKADYAVGAINAEGEAGISGAVYVYQGGANPPVMLAKLNGEGSFDKFGYAIAGGDVNADGKNDIIVSAPYTFTEDPLHANDGYQSGKVYVYFGGATISSTPDIIISGEKVNSNIGYAVAAGDINGDTIADLLFGAASSVYAFYGGADIKSRVEASATPNVNIGGGAAGSGFGRSIAVFGDIDGDSINEVAIGSPNRSVPATYDNVGSVYVFKGANNLPAKILENDATYRLAKIVGASGGDRFGSALASPGDTDDDGKADLLVGARWADSGVNPPRKITGNIYLFHGEHLVHKQGEMSVADAHAELRQDEFSTEYGSSIAVNGDTVFGGMPGASKHDGGMQLSDAKHGKAIAVSHGGSISTPTQGGDSHAEHKH